MKKITKIAMVVAMDKELQPFLKEFKDVKKEKFGCYEVTIINYNDKEIYLLKSGIGEILASCSAQFLITKYNVELVINFGVCGSLTDKVDLFETVFVDKIVHYDFDLSQIDDVVVGQYPNYSSPIIEISNEYLDYVKKNNNSISLVTCASADKFVSDLEVKENLYKTYNALVCDMECAGVTFACKNNNVPCIIVKAVSDGKGGAKEYKDRVEVATKSYIKIVKSILSDF